MIYLASTFGHDHPGELTWFEIGIVGALGTKASTGLV
jgi:hypothetical protein